MPHRALSPRPVPRDGLGVGLFGGAMGFRP